MGLGIHVRAETRTYLRGKDGFRCQDGQPGAKRAAGGQDGQPETRTLPVAKTADRGKDGLHEAKRAAGWREGA